MKCTRLLGLPVLLLFLQASVAAVAAEDPIQLSLTQIYAGKVFMLRHPCQGTRLRFDQNGALIGKKNTGPWTLYSAFIIDRVILGKGAFEVRGKRALMYYLEQNKNFKTHADEEIILQLVRGNDADAAAAFARSLELVVVSDLGDMAEHVDDAWRCFLTKDPQTRAACDAEVPRPTQGTKGLPLGVQPPQLLSSRGPSYSEQARAVGIQGSVTLLVVVTTNGQVGKVRILKPLGIGLDEAAIKAVRTWRFQPATRQGVPMDFKAQIEVAFRIL